MIGRRQVLVYCYAANSACVLQVEKILCAALSSLPEDFAGEYPSKSVWMCLLTAWYHGFEVLSSERFYIHGFKAQQGLLFWTLSLEC